MDYVYPVIKLVYDPKVKEWCRRPYPNHPKGCPALGKKNTCPPASRMIDEVLDISKPMFIVHSEFDLAAHAEKMQKRHPKWTSRQCRSLLYWQGTSRKQLRERVTCFAWAYKDANLKAVNAAIFCPEGMGVNVYETCRRSGLKLEPIKTLKTCRHVALIGSKKGKP